MPRLNSWLVIALIGNLAACSSTFTELSPTPSNGQQPTGKAGPFLNSPFFLAFETGVLVGGITQLYNWAKASSDRDLAEQKARREKQTALLSSVSTEIPAYISTMGSTRKLRAWLQDPKNQSSDAKDDVGRTRDEVLKEYADFFKLQLKTRTSTSILAEVGAHFESKEVCDLANDEERVIARIHDATTGEARTDALAAEEKIFDGLLAAMANEMNQPRKEDHDRSKRGHWCLHREAASLRLR